MVVKKGKTYLKKTNKYILFISLILNLIFISIFLSQLINKNDIYTEHENFENRDSTIKTNIEEPTNISEIPPNWWRIDKINKTHIIIENIQNNNKKYIPIYAIESPHIKIYNKNNEYILNKSTIYAILKENTIISLSTTSENEIIIKEEDYMLNFAYEET